MATMKLRAMERDDFAQVADLIHLSTNYWYQANGRAAIFTGDPRNTELFCEVYEDLDPGRCILAEHAETGRLMGSCFYHPRDTHVALGIMNVHPNHFGQGVAGNLLRFILDFAESKKLPVRLVSSAMNLDSYSLYTRHGFVPRQTYQDMVLQVPDAGLTHQAPGSKHVRNATMDDVAAMVDLEMAISGLDRRKDFEYFITNQRGIWHASVFESASSGLDGFLFSVAHPASNMIGPGVMRTEEQAIALILAQLNANAGRCPVLLVPVDAPAIVAQMYAWGARNCEIHVHQIRGDHQRFDGINMPTFMPETG